jgi:predicted acetyltransferase
MPPSLTITKIGPESDTILRNLFEHYVHDMAEWFEIDTQADGSYSYDTASIWKNGCDAYLAKIGDALAGFAILGPADASLSNGARDVQDVHEFFVIRRYRRSGLGENMAAFLWNEHPGEWLVRVLEANPAAAFWRRIIASHTGGSYTEEGRIKNGRSWRFFKFVSR